MFAVISLGVIVLFTLFSQGSRAILLPSPDPNTHAYKVAVTHFPLTNGATKDPYNNVESRSIMVSMFMPVTATHCSKECQSTYMPPQTARIANQQFLLNVTEGVFEKMEYTVCCGTSTDIDASKYPVVVLEPHVDTSRLLYANLARYMSANGVVVVLLDHPGDSSIVEFPQPSPKIVYNSGTVALSNFSPINPWNDTVTQAVAQRVQDVNFALSLITSSLLLKQHFPSLSFSSPLNTSSYGIVGHGLGGTVASSLSFSDSRVRFSINLSGTPPLLDHPSSAPIFFFGRADFRREHDIHWPSTWSRLTGPATEFDLKYSGIFDFSDLPIIVELANKELGLKGVQGRGVGTSGPWGNHAVKCFVEGVLKRNLFRDEKGLNKCVEFFEGMVPYPGGGRV